jgi:glycerol-3-phosphate acyltransferase PlsY
VAVAALLLISYLIGAIPTSVIAGRLIKGIDIRKEGSGNAGATNTWRVLGWKAGVTVLVIDLVKGMLAASAIPLLPFGPLPLDHKVVAILCGLAAVIGHVFPVYIGFRGGKGVATGAGMLLAIAPIPVGIAVGVFGLTFLLSGRVSLGSLAGAVSVPLTIALLDRYTALHYHPLLLALTCVLALFLLFTHRGNITRLLHGTERSVPRVQIWKRIFRR